MELGVGSEAVEHEHRGLAAERPDLDDSLVLRPHGARARSLRPKAETSVEPLPVVREPEYVRTRSAGTGTKVDDEVSAGGAALRSIQAGCFGDLGAHLFGVLVRGEQDLDDRFDRGDGQVGIDRQ